MPGLLALVGGAEWRAGCDFDRELLEASGGREVLVVPTAAAYEHPARAVEAAERWFGELGAQVRSLPVLTRRDAVAEANAAPLADAAFVYLAAGSPMHLRSVLKDSPVWDALVAAWVRGAVVAGSGSGAMVLCDPMVDPRGGAYTVGLGFVENVAVFPDHAAAPSHLLERSIELKPSDAVLVGIDAETALVREPDANWSVAGAGQVTVYAGGSPSSYGAGASGLTLP